jgi:hypothetical protein
MFAKILRLIAIVLLAGVIDFQITYGLHSTIDWIGLTLPIILIGLQAYLILVPSVKKVGHVN